MSTGGPSPDQSPRLWTPTWRVAAIVWAVMVVSFWAFYEFIDGKHSAVRSDLEATQSTVDQLSQQVREGNPEVESELSTLKGDFQQMSQQFENYGRSLGSYDEQFRRLADQISTAESERAVARAEVAGLSTQVGTIRDRLTKLKRLDAEWQARMASLMTGEAGQRIVGSPAHLELLVNVLDEQRPTTEEIRLWETQVEELAAPLDQAMSKGAAAIALSPKHAPMLTDLGSQVAAATSELERQHLRVAAVLKETADLPLGKETLEEAVASRQAAAAIRDNEERRRLLAEEQSKTEQVIRNAEVEKERKLREAMEAAIQANTEIELQKIKDAVAEVRREEERRQAEFQARVEQERAEARFQQALPELRKYLAPFMTPGNKHIINAKWTFTEDKKPLSFGAIKAAGALENTATGLSNFYFLAAGQDNDRPTGIFRGNYIGGNVRSELVPDVVKAQNLLKEFGDLLVAKGMLEP